MSDQFESLFPDRFKHDLHSPPMGEQDKARKMAEQVSIEIAKHFFYRGKTMEKATAPLITNALLHFAQEREGEAVGELTECEKDWIGEIASEKLSGNIVKENFARGVVSGIRIALDLIAKHSKKGAKDE